MNAPAPTPTPGREPLWVWVIYDHPRDFPDAYVARPQCETPEGIKQFAEGFAAPDLELLRDHMRRMGLTRMPRNPADDPIILEVWL